MQSEIRADDVVEPASSFENPSDYIHIFSAEDSIGWKLAAAIFDAKVCSVSSATQEDPAGQTLMPESCYWPNKAAAACDRASTRSAPPDRQGRDGTVDRSEAGGGERKADGKI